MKPKHFHYNKKRWMLNISSGWFLTPLNWFDEFLSFTWLFPCRARTIDTVLLHVQIFELCSSSSDDSSAGEPEEVLWTL